MIPLPSLPCRGPTIRKRCPTCGNRNAGEPVYRLVMSRFPRRNRLTVSLFLAVAVPSDQQLVSGRVTPAAYPRIGDVPVPFQPAVTLKVADAALDRGQRNPALVGQVNQRPRLETARQLGRPEVGRPQQDAEDLEIGQRQAPGRADRVAELLLARPLAIVPIPRECPRHSRPATWRAAGKSGREAAFCGAARVSSWELHRFLNLGRCGGPGGDPLAAGAL